MRLPHAPRRGNVLVTFALLIVALFGVAALVLDLGLARLRQQQMQKDADAAALEALRGYAPATDAARRQAAIDLTATAYANDPRRAIRFRDGIALDGTTYRASELLTLVDDVPPPLQPNLADPPDRGGDIVRGNALEAPTTRHVERPDYARDDFDRGRAADDAVLVRLRHTGEAVIPGARAPRPPLPYLFARGTLLASDAKAEGIPVRATAIAAVRVHLTDVDGNPAGVAEVGRARSVGKQVFVDTGLSTLWRPGVLPFALFANEWDALPLDREVDLSIVGGAVLRGATIVGRNGEAALTLGQTPTPFADYDLTTLRDRLPAAEPLLYGYVPIVRDGIVIGFGFADLPRDAIASASFQLIKRGQRIALANASATLAVPLPPATDIAALVAQHTNGFADSLLVPVLVRASGPAR